MAHYEIIPNTTRFECSGNAAYGLVRVRDTENPDHPELEVRVDTDPGDETRDPRIILSDGTVGIDAAFLSAYQGLKRGTATPAQETACREMGAPLQEDTVGLGHVVWPAIGVGLGYGIRKLLLNDLRIAAPDAPLRPWLEGAAFGSDAFATLTYTLIEPRLSDTAANWADGVYGLWGLAMCGVAAFAEGKGKSFAPELHQCASSLFNIGAARGYRHLGQVGGGLIELGAGGLTLGLAFLLPDGGTSPVTEQDLVAPSSLPPGSRNLESDLEERYDGSQIDFIGLGAIHLGNALIHGAYGLFTYRSTPSATPPATPPPGPPQVSFSKLPGGGLLNVTGSF